MEKEPIALKISCKNTNICLKLYICLKLAIQIYIWLFVKRMDFKTKN